jgi:hypothetical protein
VGLKLQEFQYKVEYIPGEKNGADGLSRYVQNQLCVNIISNFVTNEEEEKIMEEYYVVSGHGTSNTMKFLMKGKY